MITFHKALYIVHVGDAKNFNASKDKQIWGFKSTTACWINFMRNVKPGDILCFIKKGGIVLGYAQYVQHSVRELGPLINVSITNEELGWTPGNWDMELRFKGYVQSTSNLALKTPNQNSVIHAKYFENRDEIFAEYVQTLQQSIL